MATIFPREQKAKMLFEKIKENPQACERLMETFYDALGVGDDYEGNGLSAEQFATALFRSYEEKDLTADSLWTLIGELTASPDTLRSMGEKARSAAVPDAAERIYRAIRRVVSDAK